MLLVGWGGLLFLFYAVKPTVWGRWWFYVFWVLALTGTALPFTFLLNRRALPADSTLPAVILRQALWFGFYGAVLAWLQLSRLLNLWMIFGLGAGLIAIEYFTRLREESRWQPSADVEDVSPDHLDEERRIG